MQLKKIAFGMLFVAILLICSLSTISAANNTINSTSTGGIAQGITDTGTGDTLFLQSGTYNKTSDHGIIINKNITIQGNGSTESVVIDAQNLTQIFVISNNASVMFINVTFINGRGTNGGAVQSAASGNTLTFINCTFVNNTATSNGGAIYNVAEQTITNCNFINNTANNGGSVYNYLNANQNITNCNFTNNKGLTTGGVIYNSGKQTITNCNFINNTANNAGVIYSTTNTAVQTVINSSFVNNTAASNGGAIYTTSYSNQTVINSSFVNNTAASNGGAIYTTGYSNQTVINSSFVNNTAASNGGAVYNYITSKITVIGNTMINNTANNVGGAISNLGNMFVSDNTMSGNSAGLGQMIYNNGTMGVLNLTFIDNSTWVVKNGSTITLYATLVDDRGNTVTGRNISFYLDGVLVENVTSIEGYANITYTTSNTGDIPVSGVYAGNGAYDILINNGLLKVRIPTKITVSVPKEVKVGDTVTLESRLTDEDGNLLAGKTVDFYVDGVKVGSGVTDKDGIAKLNYTFTKAGKPKVEAKFAGDSTYGPSNATNSTTVSKIPTNTTVKTDKDTITITLTDENGNLLANKKVTIIINGKTYTKTTNSQGQIVMKYKNAWDYKVTANFAGDEKYLASKATAPKRTPTKTTIKTKGDKVTATLTDKNGKPLANKKLTFRVKGVIIGVGITDANGQVVIYYKNADKKVVTVSFEGDNEYMPSNATSTPAKSENVQASGKVAMKNTGIPITTVLLALIASMGLITLRKRE